METNYDQIAQSFSSTRYAIWSCAGRFIDSLDKYNTLLDAGCGNGKYANYRKDITWFGCDLSMGLLNIAQDKNDRVAHASITKLPYKDCAFDATMSIAVIHHLDRAHSRAQALKEIMRVTKQKALITVWAREQPIKSKWRDLGAGDFLIPWQNISMRYYHLFTREEFEYLIKQLEFPYEITFERDNWCAIIYKDS